MKILFVVTCLLAVGTAASAAGKPNPEGPPLSCADYQHHPDGSWSTKHEVMVEYPNGHYVIAANTTFPAGESYNGMPFSALLDQQCGS